MTAVLYLAYHGVVLDVAVNSIPPLALIWIENPMLFLVELDSHSSTVSPTHLTSSSSATAQTALSSP